MSAPVTRERALAVAQQIAAERGWPWEGPFHIDETRTIPLVGRRELVVRSNTEMRGRNVTVRIDATTGEVRFAAFGRR